MSACTCCSCKIHSRGEFHTGELVSPLAHLKPVDTPRQVKAKDGMARAVEKEAVAHVAWSDIEVGRRLVEGKLLRAWEHRGGIKAAPLLEREELERLSMGADKARKQLRAASEAVLAARQVMNAAQAEATQTMIDSW